MVYVRSGKEAMLTEVAAAATAASAWVDENEDLLGGDGA